MDATRSAFGRGDGRPTERTPHHKDLSTALIVYRPTVSRGTSRALKSMALTGSDPALFVYTSQTCLQTCTSSANPNSSIIINVLAAETHLQ
ncbi:hypothetical protein M8J76_009365 [Diaphorina citri]|nr:hypothetical protein M8J76_009365 [Diaphorina citri]